MVEKVAMHHQFLAKVFMVHAKLSFSAASQRWTN
jgi:hypothetical protein